MRIFILRKHRDYLTRKQVLLAESPRKMLRKPNSVPKAKTKMLTRCSRIGKICCKDSEFAEYFA